MVDGPVVVRGFLLVGIVMKFALGCASGGGQSAAPDAAAARVVRDAAVPVSETEFLCDGIDNNGNGAVDDVDVENDGICDCLKIALIGRPGVLDASSFLDWLNDRGASVERVLPSEGEFTREFLDQYDVLILDFLQRGYTEAEAEIFKTWIAEGGTAISMTGYSNAETDKQRPNSLMAGLGVAYVRDLVSGPIVDFSSHPVIEGVNSITFKGGFAIQAAEATGDVNNETVGLIGGEIVALAHTRGKGRVLIWGDEWIQFDSEWSSMPAIGQLWVNIFRWLDPPSTCQFDLL